MAIVDALFRSVDDQPIPVPITGVLVHVFDNTGAFVAAGTTNPSGETTIPLLGDPTGVPYTARFFKTGVSFSSNGTLSALVKDPPSPPNTFEISGHVGMSGSLCWLRTLSDDPTPVPIPDCRIRLFDSFDTFMTELNTDASGEVSAILTGSPSPGTTYITRLMKNGWTFEDGLTQLIQVLNPLPIGATNEFDFVAHTARIPESTNPYFCVISGYLCLASGAPIRRAKVRFCPRPQAPSYILSGGIGQSTPAIVEGKVLVGEVYETTSDTGYLEVTLPRGGIFDVDVLGWSDYLWPSQAALVVPTTAGAKLEDVLFPYTSQVVLGMASPISIPIGGYVEMTIKLLGSNDQEVTGKELVDKFIQWTIVDGTVVTAQITEAGLLRLDGKAVGSTTLTFSRTDDSYVPRVPSIPALIAPSLMIGVTA